MLWPASWHVLKCAPQGCYCPVEGKEQCPLGPSPHLPGPAEHSLEKPLPPTPTHTHSVQPCSSRRQGELWYLPTQPWGGSWSSWSVAGTSVTGGAEKAGQRGCCCVGKARGSVLSGPVLLGSHPACGTAPGSAGRAHSWPHSMLTLCS